MAGKQHDRPYRRDKDNEDNEADVQAFQGRHRSFSDRLERFVMQLVILGLVGLVLVQTLQVIPGLRRQMSLVDALEGVTPNERSAWSQLFGTSGPATTPAPPLTVTVVLASQRSAPEATLLVDGKAVGNFAGGSVTANVKPGQVVAVDGTGSSQALIFRVVGALGVASPEIGLTVTTHRNQQRLGDVRAGK
ncbi:MAG: hypothetical protein JWN15_3206 [Firmicutes bacterium]|nr:hypothetical protein [Bacillota bacterium]